MEGKKEFLLIILGNKVFGLDSRNAIYKITVVPQYPREIDSRMPVDSKVHGCSSPLYKIA